MHNLLRLVGRRLIALPIMALGVSFLIFFLMSFSKSLCRAVNNCRLWAGVP